MKHAFLLVLGCLLAGPLLPLQAADKVIKIYHDSDYSSHAESAESMKMGFLTALDEVDNRIGDYRIEFVEKNHRGNVVRSQRTMKQFLKDPQALFILGGLHSPPYLKFRQYINENEILLLVPWAAGGPITRYTEGTNWVFRLSVDDAKAGIRISDYAIRAENCESPHLLLEDTGWGKGNFRTMTGYFEKEKKLTPAVTWFNWNTKASAAKVMLRDIANSGSDCLIFVGNAIEGAVFMRAIDELGFDLPVLSHWGITGGDFAASLGSEILRNLDLHFVQSCFSFTSSAQTDFTESVFRRGQKLFPRALASAESLQAPTGFIHAYDMGRLVIAAMKQLQLTDDMAENRRLLRDKLEQLYEPVEGLVKTYQQPFTPFTPANTDAHEALGLQDLCMAEYTPEGVIKVKGNNPADWIH